MIKTVKDLLDKSGMVVKPVNLEMKAGGKDVNSYRAHFFLDRPFVIDRFQPIGKLFYMFFLDEDGMQSVKVPDTLELKIVVGKERARLLRMHKTHTFSNLRHNLGKYFQVGSDPEIFVENEKGECIPAFDFLGSKQKPDKSPTGPSGYGNTPMYWDGFQAEFVTRANDCLAWQVDSVQCGLEGVLNKARQHNPKAKLSAMTVMDIPYKDIKEGKEEHIQFGCMPSKNAYGHKGLQTSGRDVMYRSAGGHIHFGIDNGHVDGPVREEVKIKMVKALDAILGVACVSLFAKFDNPQRRQMYGLAGEYRTPPHGLEYRVLSNAWLFHPLIMNLVFDLSRKALVFGEKDYMKYWKATEQETIDCINKCDVALSKKILRRNKKIMIALLRSAYTYLNEKDAEKFFNIFINGMQSVVKDPTDIENNWNLNKGWIGHSDGKGKNVDKSLSYIKEKKKVA